MLPRVPGETWTPPDLERKGQAHR